MFKITGHRGFQMTFLNGVTVSVQFGPGCYCENRNNDYDLPKTQFAYECIDAEVAVWDREGNWILREYNPELSDDVDGYQTVDDVLRLLNWASEYKGGN